VEDGWTNKCSKNKQSGLDGEHVPLYGNDICRIAKQTSKIISWKL
jgi:hypothetical protein